LSESDAEEYEEILSETFEAGGAGDDKEELDDAA
jgi:hypothetical protein